mgnify:CR=1 FL=1
MRTILLSLLLSFNLSYAETPQEKGLRLAKLIDKANEDFKGDKSDMEMVLINAYGQKVTRKMKSLAREGKGNVGSKSLMEFVHPQDVKGTKLLTWSYKEKDDDQWLYLPAMRRVKRISSEGKSASFMGSEFSYEDLRSQEVEKFTYKFLKVDELKGKKTWVIERKSKMESGYTKQIATYDQERKVALKVEYYDRKKELLKVAKSSDFKKFVVGDKELYRASKIHMKNMQTKKESIMNWKDRKLGVNISERELSLAALR